MPEEFYAAIRKHLSENKKVPHRVGWRIPSGYCEAQVFPDDIKKVGGRGA